MPECPTNINIISPSEIKQKVQSAMDKSEDIIESVQEVARDAYTESLSTLNTIAGIISGAISGISTNINCSGGGDYDGGDPTRGFGSPPSPPNIGSLDIPEPIDTEYNETLPQLTNLGELVFNELYDEISSGSTGLTQSVMDDIYDWEEESDLQDLQDTKDRIATGWARNGSILPDSILYSLQAWVDITHQNKRLSKSRDVRIESLKMATENARFAKELSVKLEDMIFKYLSEYWNRRIEYITGVWKYGYIAYDYLLKYKMLLVEIYKAEAQAFGSMSGWGQAQATVMAANVSAESRFDVAKCQAEADKVKAEIEKAKAQAELASSAAGAIARVGAALASGAMSAINAGANISFDARASEGTNLSNQLSCSTQWTGELES